MRQIAKFSGVLLFGIVIGAWGIPALRAQIGRHTAYVVAEIHVTDPAGFMQYVGKVPASLAPYHARTLARALPDVREGAPPDGQVVILGFDSLQDANHWYSSAANNELIPLRQKSATSRVYIVDGLPQ
jgi:uncharacterized protein (DUF1330 family)